MTPIRSVLRQLNPFRNTGVPAVACVVVGAVCIAAGPDAWILGFLPGLGFCVIGTRIAYGHRGADRYLDVRASVPLWGIGLSRQTHRQIEGAVVAVIGLFLLGMGAAGVAHFLH
jgi:hypothetical protein